MESVESSVSTPAHGGAWQPTQAGAIALELAMAAVLRELPQEVVREAVVGAGSSERRSRLLPGWLTVYAVLALRLAPTAPQREALSLVWRMCEDSGAATAGRDMPTLGALVRARDRLGSEPLVILAGWLTTRIDAVLGETTGSRQADLEYLGVAGRPEIQRLRGRDGLLVACRRVDPAATARPARHGSPVGPAGPVVRLPAVSSRKPAAVTQELWADCCVELVRTLCRLRHS